MKREFIRILKGNVVLVGIGNPLRGDDGAGPALIQKLQGHVKATCLDVGSAPENYVGKIAKEKPDTVLLVDAVHLGLAPGGVRILAKEDLLKTGFTTHDLSPTMVIQYLESQTKAAVYLLGIQPQSVELGTEMTPAVCQTLKELTQLIQEVAHA